MDPRAFKSEDEFLRAYNVAWGFAQAAEQILAFVSKNIEEAEAITKKEKGEVKNVLREAVS